MTLRLGDRRSCQPRSAAPVTQARQQTAVCCARSLLCHEHGRHRPFSNRFALQQPMRQLLVSDITALLISLAPAPRIVALHAWPGVQVSQNEIREALESSDEDAKVAAMEKAITAILAGEQFPTLFITIVRYVLPSENHMVQKLLLLYLVSGEGREREGGSLGAQRISDWRAGKMCLSGATTAGCS